MECLETIEWVAYSASIEWECEHAGTVRIHPGLGKTFLNRDPYVWSTTLIKRGDVCWFKGACRPLPQRAIRPLLAELYRAGIRWRVHERVGPTLREIRKPVKEPRD